MKNKIWRFLLYVTFLLMIDHYLVGQSVNLQLQNYRICDNQVAVELFVGASEFATDTFSLGNSSIFLNYDGTKVRFRDYLPAAFDPEISEQAMNANWEEQQYDYNDEYGIFHVVLQKNDGGEENYILQKDTASIKIGTVIFDFWEGGITHDVAVNFSFTKFNDDIANDGSNEIQLENAPILEVFNDTIFWMEDFDDLLDSIAIDSSVTSWTVDSTATNAKSPDHYIGTERGAFKFKALEGEAVWRSGWIDLCGNAVNISVDAKENGQMEPDDYIRFYYEVFDFSETAAPDSSEVLFGAIEGDAVENNTYMTLTTGEKVSGDQFRVIVRVKNGGNGNFENHFFDNLRLSTSDCFQQVKPEMDGITDNFAEISWNPDFRATAYELRYRFGGETTWDPTESNGVFSIITTSPEDSIKNLLANTTYEYQVRSVCDTITAPFSEVQSFRTNNCPNFDNDLIGRACNDGNSGTINDVYTSSCVCRGEQVLPIELRYFSAELIEDYVHIKWSTISELNNDYFTIERSQSGNNWDAIATIDGAGNSTEELNYWEIDSFPLPGVSYYRLVQTDYDGRTSVSRVVSVTREGTANEEFIVFPNPTTGRLSFSTAMEGNYQIFDAYGKIMQQGILMNEDLDISDLSSGVYIIVIEKGNERHVRRVVKE